MANFSYKVKNSNGAIEQGNIDAINITDAAIKLERDGYIVLEIKESSNSDFIYSDYEYNIPFSSKMVLSVREKKRVFQFFLFPI